MKLDADGLCKAIKYYLEHTPADKALGTLHMYATAECVGELADILKKNKGELVIHFRECPAPTSFGGVPALWQPEG